MKREIFNKIDKILWNDWNPIEINKMAPRDEYRGYVLEIYKMVQENKTEIVIAEKLYNIEKETIGLKENLNHCKYIANKILKKVKC